MAHKITLSIPDLLHEKMEEWRKYFNFSKMFQDALSDAIRKKEEFQKRLQEDLDMTDIIERLKQEKLQSEGNYSDRGKIEGLLWAKSAHYDDLVHAMAFDSAAEIAADDRLSAYFSDIFSKDRLLDCQGSELNKFTRLFLDGWQRGLSDFWNEIKEKL